MTPLAWAAVLAAAAVLMSPRPCGRPAGHTRRAESNKFPVVLAAALIAAVALTTSPALLVAGAIGAGMGVGWRRRQRAGDRRRAEGQAMACALELLIGELRVGAHPARAFAVAGAESPDPVGPSLQAISVRSGLGADVVSGLHRAAAQSCVPHHWMRLAACWNLAAQHGLAISTLMRAAHREIVERQRFGDRIDAALAGARATAAILALLPALGVLLGQLVGAHPVRFLLGGGAGGVLLVVGAALIAIGLVWADRIIEGAR